MMAALERFAGLWTFTRSVENASGPDAEVTGEARFTPDDSGLVLHEAGEMRLAGQGAFRAERRYLWRTGGAGIAVYFEDGRWFHDFDPEARAPRAEHACAPDHYRVAYDFGAWPEWRATWEVAGPRKSYVMRTLYRRG